MQRVSFPRTLVSCAVPRNLKAQTALAALRAYSVHPLSKILTWTTQVAAPTTVTDKIGDILVKSADPVADVLTSLYPTTPRELTLNAT